MSNFVGGDLVGYFGVIVKGGRFSLGLICNGRSLEGIKTLKWRKFFDAVVETSPLYMCFSFRA